jgi:catechol 2,3-dioxygenase-like lactoylglutathione lyase family enzyme
VSAVRYLVADLDAALAFYVEKLGFEVVEDWGPVVVCKRDELELWLSGPESSAAEYPLRANRLVLHVADLDAALAQAGPAPDVVESPAGRWAAVEDPEGNLVELFERP